MTNLQLVHVYGTLCFITYYIHNVFPCVLEMWLYIVRDVFIPTTYTSLHRQRITASN